VPSAFTLGALTIMLLTQDLLGYTELVVNRGLGLSAVARIAFYQTVPLVALTLPFAMLVGCLIGLGRMGADRELLVLEASGVSSPRLIGPVLMLAAFVTSLGFALSLYASPWSNRSLDESLERVSRQNPAASISAGVVQNFGDWKLEAREVSPGGDKLKGVLVWMPDVGETAFAERGELTADPKGARVVLHNGSMVFDPRERAQVLHFERMVTYLPREDAIIERSSADRLKGFRLQELLAAVASESGETGRQSAQVELHRRFALPSASLVFGLLVVPLFFSRSHFSRSGGGVVGILATIAYYGLVQLGDGMIQAGTLSVAGGVWLPNIVGGIAAFLMVLRLTRMSAFGRHSDRPTSKEPKAERDDRPTVLRPKRWALQRYIANRFLQLVGLCFSALLVAYFLVDVLERLDWFAKYSPTAGEFARYYAARLPLLASRVIPMALLLATGLTVSLLAAQGEMIGMRACGIPAPRALAPVLIICFVAAPLYFLLTDEVLPRTNAYYYHMKNVVIAGKKSATGSTAAVWYRVGNSVYEAEDLDSNAGTARDIKVYELDENSQPTSRLDAVAARHIGSGVWRLRDPVRVNLSEQGIRRAPAGPFAKLGEGLEARVNTRRLSVSELRREIEEVEEGGMDATHFKVDYYVKWAAPLSCIVLPALALFFAVGGPPFPSAALTAVASGAAAVAFILGTGVSTSLGYGKGLHPMVAGWGPPAVFGLVAAYLGFRLRNLGRR